MSCMPWGPGWGRGWGRGFGPAWGRGRGWCWQYLYDLLKKQGREKDFEKYLMDPRPCWMIVQEILGGSGTGTNSNQNQ